MRLLPLVLVVACAAVLLHRCGERVLESSEADLQLLDPLAQRWTAEPHEHQRPGDGKVLRAPLLVGDVPEPGPPLAPMHLLKVAVELLPPVDCDHAPDWLMASRAFAAPAPVDAARLAELGKPQRSAELWVIAATHLRRDPRIHPDDTPEAASLFQFGPDWFGIPLRQAGPGQTLLFPPSQDCAHLTRAHVDSLPVRATLRGTPIPDIGSSGFLKIPADVPFVARIIEACPLQLRQKSELLDVLRGPIYLPRSRVWRFTLSIHGDCAGRRVTLGATL